jgi:hypothetical protein
MGERSAEVEGTFLLYVILGVDETEGQAVHIASVRPSQKYFILSTAP